MVSFVLKCCCLILNPSKWVLHTEAQQGLDAANVETTWTAVCAATLHNSAPTSRIPIDFAKVFPRVADSLR